MSKADKMLESQGLKLTRIEYDGNYETTTLTFSAINENRGYLYESKIEIYDMQKEKMIRLGCGAIGFYTLTAIIEKMIELGWTN